MKQEPPTAADWASCLTVLAALRDDPDAADHPDAEAVAKLVARLQRIARKRRRKAGEVGRRTEDRAACEATGLLLSQPTAEVVAAPTEGNRRRLNRARVCHLCGKRFRELHFHHHRLCPDCARFNWDKRVEHADLNGRTALVTGGRVNIGFATALRLLRSGATVHVTTRFPRDAAARYAGEPDFANWRDRLHVHGLDLRDLPAVIGFADGLSATCDGLDILVNNAAQTIRREPEAYAALMAGERAGATASPESPDTLARRLPNADGLLPSPSRRNSWMLRAHEVAPMELLEVLLINTASPFVLVGRLKPLMLRSRFADRHIVNVSAAEGRFSRDWRSPAHPHTNMAKAALNMLTRTSADEFAASGIYINSVDPGWVSRQNPDPVVRDLRRRGDVAPLDSADAAARVCDPIFRGVSGKPVWGLFLKDFAPVDW